MYSIIYDNGKQRKLYKNKEYAPLIIPQGPRKPPSIVFNLSHTKGAGRNSRIIPTNVDIRLALKQITNNLLKSRLLINLLITIVSTKTTNNNIINVNNQKKRAVTHASGYKKAGIVPIVDIVKNTDVLNPHNGTPPSAKAGVLKIVNNRNKNNNFFKIIPFG